MLGGGSSSLQATGRANDVLHRPQHVHTRLACAMKTCERSTVSTAQPMSSACSPQPIGQRRPRPAAAAAPSPMSRLADSPGQALSGVASCSSSICHQVVPAPATLAAKNDLFPVVVFGEVFPESPLGHAPAGKSQGRFLDVRLRVSAPRRA